MALAVATVLGVGYLPKMPGTFGALAGTFLMLVTNPFFLAQRFSIDIGIEIPTVFGRPAAWVLFIPPVLVFLFFAVIGTLAASRVAAYAGVADPQYVVIDEVSGLHLTLLLGLVPFGLPTHLSQNPDFVSTGVYFLYFALSLLNWKYLLAGFILFRVFDIWKPFPVRRLESLPRGWGIMADDWMAGVYAAIVLRIALHFGLV
ncbi:MAG TPA: phosphatidylglycerophosphatase A [Methylomirabilota bacterium]|nr:phosphatidylglycerophosphatase A [Methylomirabilota bacterium]